jgi:hypothetical protein
MTSLTVEEFDQLVPAFEGAFQQRMQEWCLEGKKRSGGAYRTYANCPLPQPARWSTWPSAWDSARGLARRSTQRSQTETVPPFLP